MYKSQWYSGSNNETFLSDRNIVTLSICLASHNDINNFENLNRYGAIAHINVSGADMLTA